MNRKTVVTAMLLTVVAVLNNSALAAYDSLVSWSDMSLADLSPVLTSQYGSYANLFDPVIPESAFEVALKDADNLIDNEFDTPTALRESVAFWLRIYTKYTTQHVVLFDERHPEIVYEVMDFRELSRTSRNRAAYEIVMRNRLKKALHRYDFAFKRLSKNPRPKRPTKEETSILTAIQKCRQKLPMRELRKNLRTQTGQRDNIIKGLIAAELFFPKMEEIFENARVPREITRLALVESSFNLKAVSRAGAVGVWQFLRRSALEYMVVNEKLGLDERLSPLKSTHAAAKLLARNKRILGTWPLAITAYNHGTKNLRKIPKKWKKFENLGALFSPSSTTSPLGFASRNYYAEFLAVLYAESYRELFFGSPPSQNPQHIQFLTLAKPIKPLSFAITSSIGLHEFRFLNPDIRDLNKTLPRGYKLAVPSFRNYAITASAATGRDVMNSTKARGR